MLYIAVVFQAGCQLEAEAKLKHAGLSLHAKGLAAAALMRQASLLLAELEMQSSKGPPLRGMGGVVHYLSAALAHPEFPVVSRKLGWCRAMVDSPSQSGIVSGRPPKK